MSVQFGRWNFEGRPPAPDYLEKVSATLAPYGPDSNESYSHRDAQILYRAFHTTKESRLERQPHTSPSGAVITWDGRLDNRVELVNDLRNAVSISCADVTIVAAAYAEWGTNCFAKLIGDWALSIWNPHHPSLILAKDPIGTRHLYYSFDSKQVTWCTILDPLALFAGKTFALNLEYIAGWLAMFPAPHLTPYVGIHSAPPASLVFIRPECQTLRMYWDFDPDKKLHYRFDGEYEEHFRIVFAKAVQRSLRSDRPVVAELSGGRDSSSIVCMADRVIAAGASDTRRLDTLSMYDDSEPNWNERPYFTKVEEIRGRTGWHVDVGQQEKTSLLPNCDTLNDFSLATPGHNGHTSPQIRMCLARGGNRVVLSGVGGDETMGGVPTPIPELRDLLTRGQFGALAHQLRIWALQQRKPWFHLFLETLRGFFPPILVGVPKHMKPIPWLQSRFVKLHWKALTAYPARVTLSGGPPSFQDSVCSIGGLQRQLGCIALPFEPPFEKRYPYLDRDLLEFMFAVPPEQLVRPTQRRSLMRRALVGIVPEEILNRNRKAFVARAPRMAISTDWYRLMEMTQNMLTDSLGIVDPCRFLDALQTARRGEAIHITLLMRTIYLEGWLGDLRSCGLLNAQVTSKRDLAWLTKMVTGSAMKRHQSAGSES